MEENKNEQDKIKKIIKTIAILLLTAIITTLVILTFIIPDFWEKIIAFGIVIGIVLFIPLSILLLFSKHETFWDRFF